MNVICPECTEKIVTTNPCCNAYSRYTGSNVPYTGPVLNTLGINPCDTINVALEKLEIKITELEGIINSMNLE